MVVWLTGLSGAGKTTIAQALYKLVKPIVPETMLIDGDVIRELFGAGLGYHEAARRDHIGRVQGLANWFARQDLMVIVAALYAHPELMRWNRENLPGYFEVYVDAPLSLLRTRDSKGLYAGAAAGTIPNVVGVDIPWHTPERPDLVIDVTRGEAPAEIAARIAHRVPRLAKALGAGVQA